MMNRLNRLERRIPKRTNENQWQRFAQVVITNLPMIEREARTVLPAESHRVAEKIVIWLNRWQMEFITEAAFQDLVFRITGISRDRIEWNDCSKYTSDAMVKVIGLIFPAEAFDAFKTE